MRGIYISLDGPDGCGKSTQAARLAQEFDAILTREPGGTQAGKEIRKILLDAKYNLDPETAVLLFSADRRQHIAEVVGPALARGRIVVSDRSYYSTIAYQSFGHGVQRSFVDRATELGVGPVRPDIPIMIDIDYDTAHQRMHKDNKDIMSDRFERGGRQFHDRVRQGIRSLAEELGSKALLVDGSGTSHEVTQEIIDKVKVRIPALILE